METFEPDPVIEAYKKDIDRTLIVAELAALLEECGRASKGESS